jgi:hypothetical protein
MKKYIGQIPLIIIICLMIYSIYTVSTTNIAFSYEHYMGFAVIVISTIVIFFNSTFSKIFTGIGLLGGVFSLVAFTPTINYYRIGYTVNRNGMDIKIQMYCVLLFLLFIILNFDFLKSLFKRKKIE